MGIALQELLDLECFKDFQVVAGKNGLQREVQGITVLEAPDAYQWACGKELVLSTGYVIAQNPDCIRNAFEEGNIQKTSGLIIKRERYLTEIPQEMIELFDRYSIPLLTMPFSVSYMEVMNQVNIAVMNRTIRRFRIHGGNVYQPSNQTYKVQKIQRILQALEGEMNFPAFLYDLTEQKGYYSSPNFKRITESFGLKEEDYWEPSMPYTRHTLCDYIHMTRLRLINPGNAAGPRVSWILIPIIMNGVTQAYFIVMESREFLDYYDETAIRIGFLLLQAVYEQIMVAQNVGNVGFENFILFALNYHEPDNRRLMYQANIQGISMSNAYVSVVFRQTEQGQSMRGNRKELVDAFQSSSASRIGKMALLEENEGILLLDAGDASVREKEKLCRLLEEFRGKVQELCSEMKLEFGVCRDAGTLAEIQTSVSRCRSVLSMGRVIFPKESIWDYEMLGPLAWLKIPEDELETMLVGYRELLKEEKNEDLLRTLKVYLENNMNYSVTAEKLYVHINTIRKRIDRIRELLPADWDDPVGRLKTELLLQFLGL
jgi:purine catabolism regulator